MNYSETERQNIKLTTTEMSDRQAMSELLDRARKQYVEYKVESLLKEQAGLLEKMDKMTGSKTYHKIDAIKADPDTMLHAVFYFDDRNVLITSVCV